MKKFITVLLCVVLSLSCLVVFSGCKDDGIIEIKLGMWPDSGLGEENAMFNEWKTAFESDYPQYRIVPSAYTYNPSSVSFDAYGGTLPTVFQTYFTEPERLISEGWIRPITKQLNDLGWADKIEPNMKAAVTRNGEIYGVPRDGYGMGMFLNMEMLYEAGWLDKYPSNHPLYPNKYRINDDEGNPLYPTTFEELMEVSRDVVDSSPSGTYGMIILSASRQGGWQFSNMAWNFGLESFVYKDGSGKWQSRLNDPKVVEALQWIKDMRTEELIFPDASLTYSDWYLKIIQKKCAIAFCGSDAIANPVNNSSGVDKFDKDNIAFVPMPAKAGVDGKALFGGTPFVFASNASDEQVEGALKFLEYMGRSPLTSDIAKKAIRDGNMVAQRKGMPILPTIRPWINEDYVSMMDEFDDEFINVDMIYYKDFFDSIGNMKRDEEPVKCQEMYEVLDLALQSVLSGSAGTVTSFLTTANTTFYNSYLSKVN